MAKLLRKPVPKPPKQKGAPDERREQAFILYRELGPQRSLRKLAEVLKLRWPANHVSHVTLQNWSKKGEWQKRVTEFDLGQSRGAAPSAPIQRNIQMDVDPVSALHDAASRALQMIASATSLTIARPADLKVVLDAARMAKDLAERIEKERTSSSTEDEVAAFMRQLIGKLDIARRKDYALTAKVAAEAACSEAGTTNLKPVFVRVAAALGLRVDGEGKIDVDVGDDPVAVGDGDDGADALVAGEDAEALASNGEVLGSNGEEVEQVSPDTAMDDEDSVDGLLKRLKGEQ